MLHSVGNLGNRADLFLFSKFGGTGRGLVYQNTILHSKQTRRDQEENRPEDPNSAEIINSRRQK